MVSEVVTPPENYCKENRVRDRKRKLILSEGQVVMPPHVLTVSFLFLYFNSFLFYLFVTLLLSITEIHTTTALTIIYSPV
jgi:hypothetical protein